MASVIAEIEAQVRSLSSAERAELIRALIADLDGPPEVDVERSWAEEAERRHRELRERTVQPIPGDRVFENLGSRLKR